MIHNRLILACSLLLIALPVLAQEKMYPVRANDSTVVLNSDRSAFVIERAFQHKLMLGFPDDDVMEFLPNTKAPVAVFWARIQNVSTKPLEVNIAKFTATDD